MRSAASLYTLREIKKRLSKEDVDKLINIADAEGMEDAAWILRRQKWDTSNGDHELAVELLRKLRYEDLSYGTLTDILSVYIFEESVRQDIKRFLPEMFHLYIWDEVFKAAEEYQMNLFDVTSRYSSMEDMRCLTSFALGVEAIRLTTRCTLRRASILHNDRLQHNHAYAAFKGPGESWYEIDHEWSSTPRLFVTPKGKSIKFRVKTYSCDDPNRYKVAISLSETRKKLQELIDLLSRKTGKPLSIDIG